MMFWKGIAPILGLGVVGAVAATTTQGRAMKTYVDDKIHKATPTEVKVETIAERLAQKQKDMGELRTSVARIDETKAVLAREADEYRQRVQARSRRIEAGEEVLRRARGGQDRAFDPAQVERALGQEKKDLAADEGQLKQRVFRLGVLDERAVLYRKKLGEFATHITGLQQRLDGLRRMQAENRTLEELVAVQAEIEKQFALPGACTPDFGDELVELEVELKAQQATLTERLAGSLPDTQDVLGRAVEAVEVQDARTP